MGDENVHLVRNLLDEVFGSENFVGEIVFVTSTGRTSKNIDCVADHILWYSKNVIHLKYRQLFIEKTEQAGGELSDEMGKFELADLSSQHESNSRW